MGRRNTWERRRWGLQQYEEVVRSECEARGYIYLGFKGDWKGAQTYLHLECTKHSHRWSTTKVSAFLNSKKGCILCGREMNSQARVRPFQSFVDGFMSTGKFAAGTIFRRVENSASGDRGHVSEWEYECSVCKRDEYVQLGLCKGVFKSTGHSLLAGKMSCRCSPCYSWTRLQAEHNVARTLKPPHSFVRWETDNGSVVKDRLRFNCELHGDWVTLYSSVVDYGTRCSGCSETGYNLNKLGYIYLLKIAGDKSFTGYGITNVPSHRMSKHLSSLERKRLAITERRWWVVQGKHAWDIEAEVKVRFPVVSQGISGFIKEATYADLYEEVAEFIEQRYTTLYGSCNPQPSDCPK